jgi:type II secretory pathway component PulL
VTRRAARQVFHSAFNQDKTQVACNAAVLPLKTKVKGPAPPAKAGEWRARARSLSTPSFARVALLIRPSRHRRLRLR